MNHSVETAFPEVHATTTNLLVWAVLNQICQPDVEQTRPDWQNK